MDNPINYLSPSELDSSCNNCATAHRTVGVAQALAHVLAKGSNTQIGIAVVGLASHVVISALGCVNACEVRADEAY
jgi:hypothetical protein